MSDFNGPVEGFVNDRGGEVFNIRNPAFSGGAKGDAVRVYDAGSIASGSTLLTWNNGSFQLGSKKAQPSPRRRIPGAISAGSTGFGASDVSKIVTVQGAGPSGAVLSTTIASVQSPTQATLAHAASTSVTSADFAYGTDDTAAIVAAIASAGANGRLFAPSGVYMIRGASNGGNPLTVTSPGGILGLGGASGNTTFLCGDAAAGLVLNGSAYQGFLCDGNGVATAPIGMTGSSHALLMDVWAKASAGNGWNIDAVQATTYLSCGSADNALDGVHVSGTSAGVQFWHLLEEGSGRYGVHGAAGTRAIQFFGGRLRSTGNRSGVSKVFLRGATDWAFMDTRIVGDSLSGPTIDLDQSSGGFLDFSGCWVSATPTGGNPGRACIRVAGSPPAGASDVVFLVTERMNFLGGDTSVLIEGSGSYGYNATSWIHDATSNGPRSAAGQPGADTLLSGRTGAWRSVSLNSPWSGQVRYRIGSSGFVELSGSASTSGGGGTMFTLAAGYFNAGAPAITMPVAVTNGTATTVTIDGNGNVSAGDPGGGEHVGLDNIAFPRS